MSAFSDLMHDIADRLRFHTEQQVKDMHETIDKVEEEIRSWVTPSGVKSMTDVQTKPHDTDPSTGDNPDTPNE